MYFFHCSFVVCSFLSFFQLILWIIHFMQLKNNNKKDPFRQTSIESKNWTKQRGDEKTESWNKQTTQQPPEWEKIVLDFNQFLANIFLNLARFCFDLARKLLFMHFSDQCFFWIVLVFFTFWTICRDFSNYVAFYIRLMIEKANFLGFSKKQILRKQCWALFV